MALRQYNFTHSEGGGITADGSGYYTKGGRDEKTYAKL